MRSNNDGQIGFMVERSEEEGGGLGVRLDRRQENIVLPYSPSRWTVDHGSRLTKSHIARVAFEADRALRSARGEYGGAKSWMELPEKERLTWTSRLPAGADEERAALFAAVVGALGE